MIRKHLRLRRHQGLAWRWPAAGTECISLSDAHLTPQCTGKVTKLETLKKRRTLREVGEAVGGACWGEAGCLGTR